MKNIKNLILALLIANFLPIFPLMANQKKPNILTFDKTKNNEESFESSLPRNFRDLNNPEDKININAKIHNSGTKSLKKVTLLGAKLAAF